MAFFSVQYSLFEHAVCGRNSGQVGCHIRSSVAFSFSSHSLQSIFWCLNAHNCLLLMYILFKSRKLSSTTKNIGHRVVKNYILRKTPTHMWERFVWKFICISHAQHSLYGAKLTPKMHCRDVVKFNSLLMSYTFMHVLQTCIQQEFRSLHLHKLQPTMHLISSSSHTLLIFA